MLAVENNPGIPPGDWPQRRGARNETRAHPAGGELTGGKCVKFGDSLSTDLAMHGRYLVGIEPTELAR